MWPDRVSNPGPLALELDELPMKEYTFTYNMKTIPFTRRNIYTFWGFHIASNLVLC